MSNIIRPNSEMHSYLKFVHTATKPSVYVKDAVVDDDSSSYLGCPGCGDKLKLLKNGGSTTCGTCGLNMEKIGNGLRLWK